MGVFVQIDDQRIELTGSEAEAAQAHMDKLQADAQRMEQQSAERAAARASAITKLAALGLTDDEIKALVG
jgi:hypothetical protein